MSEDVHAHAQQLVAQERVEGLVASDREWLGRHLETCAQCASYAASIDRALRSLRSVSARLDPSLASRTQFRVRLRTQEIREQQPRLWALWISCGFSWILGVVSAPFVWRAFAWLGREAQLPPFAWELGFALWWVLPAVAVAAVLVGKSRPTGGEAGEEKFLRWNG